MVNNKDDWLRLGGPAHSQANYNIIKYKIVLLLDFHLLHCSVMSDDIDVGIYKKNIYNL